MTLLSIYLNLFLKIFLNSWYRVLAYMSLVELIPRNLVCFAATGIFEDLLTDAAGI